jgi:hypothetical protein
VVRYCIKVLNKPPPDVLSSLRQKAGRIGRRVAPRNRTLKTTATPQLVILTHDLLHWSSIGLLCCVIMSALKRSGSNDDDGSENQSTVNDGKQMGEESMTESQDADNEMLTCFNCKYYGKCTGVFSFRGGCSHCEEMFCTDCSIHDELTEGIFCHVCIEKYDLKVKDMDADEEDDEDEDDEEEEPKEDKKKEEPKYVVTEPVVTVIIRRKKLKV